MPALKPILAGNGACVLLREATVEDAEAIASLLQRSFAEFEHLYTAGGYAATILDPEKVRQRMREGPTWVAANEEIVGTVSAVRRTAGSLYVRGMAVLLPARGQRVGEMMLNAVQTFAVNSGCRSLLLSTTPFLSAAIRLYERFGFERTAGGPDDLFGTPLFSMEKKLGRL